MSPSAASEFWNAKSVYLTPLQEAPCSLANGWSQFSIGSRPKAARSKLSVSQQLYPLSSTIIQPSHDSPFLLSCVFSWRPKWLHSTLPTPIKVTLKQLSRGTTGHRHLPSHIYPPTYSQKCCPTLSPMFPAVISPFCILGFLLTSEALLTVPTLAQAISEHTYISPAYSISTV